MGLFSRWFKREKPAIQSQGITEGTWLYDYIKGLDGSVNISLNSALSLSAFYSCIKIISETVSTLPFQLYERTRDGNEIIVPTNRLYSLVHDSPNERQTSFVFSQAEATRVATTGNSFAKITFSVTGQPLSIDLIYGGSMTVEDENGKRFFIHDLEGQKTIYQDFEIIHLSNFSIDGKLGINPVRAQSESLKRSVTAQKYGNSYFENGTHSGGVLKTDKRPPDGNIDQANKGLLRYWNRSNSGVSNAGNTSILWDGWQYEKYGDNLQESMLLDVLRMSVPEIARAYRIPIELLDSENRAQSTKHEEIMLQLRQGILPYVKMREAEYNKKLLITKEQRKKYFFKHNLHGLLRGDTEAQMRMIETMFKVQGISPNDALKLVGLPPRPGGDEYGLPFASNIKTVEKKSLNGQKIVNHES